MGIESEDSEEEVDGRRKGKALRGGEAAADNDASAGRDDGDDDDVDGDLYARRLEDISEDDFEGSDEEDEERLAQLAMQLK